MVDPCLQENLYRHAEETVKKGHRLAHKSRNESKSTRDTTETFGVWDMGALVLAVKINKMTAAYLAAEVAPAFHDPALRLVSLLAFSQKAINRVPKTIRD
jgi:hypothetical protein